MDPSDFSPESRSNFIQIRAAIQKLRSGSHRTTIEKYEPFHKQLLDVLESYGVKIHSLLTMNSDSFLMMSCKKSLKETIGN